MARTAPAPAEPSSFDTLARLLSGHGNVSPRRLHEPGPSGEQLRTIVQCALAAPDHGKITPWRLVLVPAQKRGLLSEAFALALIDRDPAASLDQIDAARDKAYRAPCLVIAVARLEDARQDIGAAERLISLGAAIQNMLLGARALGFGAGLTSGQAMSSPRLANLLGLGQGEQAICCVSIGTVTEPRPPRHRPSVDAVLGQI